ncbi:MAG TPA: Rne/Rng family ribonuclease [Rhizomicrobium sp.]|nr:Rne/Rng family ribonuclease [Rhizomicrobium sp.]
MPKRMLIDASHPEETRVVVLDGQKVDEFDFEAASKLPLKGNIYLAKVTRVEPSLQAAFVEYGGNRQGFLAFSEIHPDYYQIPMADRLALLAEQVEEERRKAEEEFESVETGTAVMTDEQLAAEEGSGERGEQSASSEEHTEEDAHDEHHDHESHEDEEPHDDHEEDEEDHHGEELHAGEDHAEEDLDDEFHADEEHASHEDEEDDESESEHPHEDEHEEIEVEAVAESETVANEDHFEEEEPILESVIQSFGESSPITNLAAEEETLGIADEQTAAEASTEFVSHEHAPQPAQALQAPRPSQRWTRRKHYKIQEVIKRRQVILVQVVKEERGNKGAALTTYLSLAGRYCVLMPNTPRGGGISRKITNANDRKRLKEAAQTLELPEGMGLIIRTAGENRTKLEIKRDYEYLLRMWDQIRELTLKSNAPACVYEEGDLIKRAIRDLYNKDVGEVLVEGDDGYRNAKDFMRMLMPSHAKNVKQHKDAISLFQRYHIEAQLDAMFTPTVNLRSGGYIVINQTEALVSIDVNSGRATREHSIEETATKTNLEAAEEIARQLRLRDLAGLIVIDFIDMEDSRNDRAVEKRLYNAVKNDRARVQIGKISQFGLLEMSRQRLRAGVIAGSTVPCPHCGGQGIVRSVESTALRLLRAIEEEGQKQRAAAILIKAPPDVAIYTLNQKRRELARIETDYGMTVNFEPDPAAHAGTFEIEKTVQKNPEDRKVIAIEAMQPAPEKIEDETEIVEEEEIEVEAATDTIDRPPTDHQQGGPQGEGGPRRRRRRRGGRGRGERNDRPEIMHEPVSAASIETAMLPREEGANGESGAVFGNTPQFGEGQQQGEGGHRRRRRRRRGRRGGRGHGEQQFLPNGNQTEGVPVDASVQDSGADFGDAHYSGAVASPEPEPVIAPPPVEISQPVVPPPELMRAPESVATAPEGPPRKGWWQRAFKRD